MNFVLILILLAIVAVASFSNGYALQKTQNQTPFARNLNVWSAVYKLSSLIEAVAIMLMGYIVITGALNYVE